MRHPAKFSKELLPVFERHLKGLSDVLDPFGGTGKLREVVPTATIMEIEPEWASLSGAIVGDATAMPFADKSFSAVCTSPTYGNRMADSFIDHQPKKKYVRNTYTHAIGRKLTKGNTGCLQWGEEYRRMHEQAWKEVHRVLKPNGLFLLNISNHIRNKEEVKVSEWHLAAAIAVGFKLVKEERIATKRQKMGEHSEASVDNEKVYVLKQV
jgi:hypothetical protein